VGTSLWLADSQYLDAAAGSSQAIDILLTSDNGKFERSYSLPITLRENSTPFRNPRDPLDVNNRGGVTAIDALMIINVLNRGNYPNGILPRARSGSQVFDRYYDVSGDNLITPIDALRIINFLNRRNVNGEAEGEARIQRGEKGFMVSISSLDTNAVDAVWRDAFASDFWFSQDSETHRKRRLF
jgi:hypothetical protein